MNESSFNALEGDMQTHFLKFVWFVGLLFEIVAWPAIIVGPWVVMFYFAVNFRLGCTDYCEEGEWMHSDGAISILVGTFVALCILLCMIRWLRGVLDLHIETEQNRLNSEYYWKNAR